MRRVLVVGAAARARELRDEGAEVVFLETADPVQAARIAVQEDVATVVTPDPDGVRAALAELDAADIAVEPG